jgi:hypothetical protein
VLTYPGGLCSLRAGLRAELYKYLWPMHNTKEEQWRYARRWTRDSEADEGAKVEWARWQVSEMSAK